MREPIYKKIVYIVLIIGLLSSIALCGVRLNMELHNRHLRIVMTEEAAAKIDTLPDAVQIFDGEAFQQGSVLLIEDEKQYSYVPDERIDVLLSQFPAGSGSGVSYVRCFHLTEKYAARYNYLGYAGAEEIENILFRAASDRNIRVLWIEPFVDAETGETITDAAVYNEVINNLGSRLQRHGLILSREADVLPAYAPNYVLVLLTCIGIIAAALVLLMTNFKLRGSWAVFLLALGAVVSALLIAADRSMSVTLFAFAAAVIAPCLAVQTAVERLRSAEGASLGRDLGGFAWSFALCILIALAGGLAVAALQSGTEYQLAIDNFRGVKLSQLIPVLFAVFVVLRRLCSLQEIRAGKKYLIVLAVLVLLVVLVLFILRTGDGILPIGTIEQRIRNWLGRILIARPRTKEFVIAWPCFGLAYALCARGARRHSWPFAVLSSIGFASVVNSFCHGSAPVWLSAVRGCLGALIGLAIGLVLTALLHKGKTNARN